jgi:phage terminase large subunit-like protein
MQKNQIIALQEEINNWNDWATQIISDNGTFHSFYAVNLKHAKKEYACFRNIMDDTAKTNFFHLPLFVIIRPDQEGKSKIAAFSVLAPLVCHGTT